MWSRIINEILFWLHLTLILAGMVFSFLASPFIVLGVVALHQVHLKVFKGCSLTLLQQKLGGLAREQRFCDSAWERFMGRYPTMRERRIFHHAQWIVPVFGAAFRFIW